MDGKRGTDMNAGAVCQFVDLHRHPDRYIRDQKVEVTDLRADCLEGRCLGLPYSCSRLGNNVMYI
jgi:hypothetical protein